MISCIKTDTHIFIVRGYSLAGDLAVKFSAHATLLYSNVLRFVQHAGYNVLLF